MCRILEVITLKWSSGGILTLRTLVKRIRIQRSRLKITGIRGMRENGLTRSKGRRDF